MNKQILSTTLVFCCINFLWQAFTTRNWRTALERSYFQFVLGIYLSIMN